MKFHIMFSIFLNFKGHRIFAHIFFSRTWQIQPYFFLFTKCKTIIPTSIVKNRYKQCFPLCFDIFYFRNVLAIFDWYGKDSDAIMLHCSYFNLRWFLSMFQNTEERLIRVLFRHIVTQVTHTGSAYYLSLYNVQSTWLLIKSIHKGNSVDN